MNDLCADIGYRSINHAGEQLCGDHLDVIEQEDGGIVIVLADGLGSGVKASILSTLTSKIISTMIAQGLSIEECVETIAATLPVVKEHGVAFSTFTILRLRRNDTAELFQYENPLAVVIRNDESIEYPCEQKNIGGKMISRSVFRLQEGDTFVLMSDGCPYAGSGNSYNMNWSREDIADYVTALLPAGYTAKTIASTLIEECDKLYEHQPADDVTACVVRIRRRVPMNILFGPPSSRDDSNRMMSLFFSRQGKHIICGGTTAEIASRWLRKPLRSAPIVPDSDVPPMSLLEGADLVTEGVVTMSRVLEYARDYIGENEEYRRWSYRQDGAAQIARLLFEEATDINFFVGRAANPAHQGTDLPIGFKYKMHVVDELAETLREMGKHVNLIYF